MFNRPLHDLQERADASFITYGPPLPDGSPIEIADTFGFYEAEYATIRRGVGILHQPQRAVLRFTGKDRQDFLHRLCTQDIRGMTGGQTRRAFQLNDKGRIMADMIVHHGDADTWLEMDVFDAAPVRELLESRLFSEDVTIEDWRDRRDALALHGPAAVALLQAITDDDDQRVAAMPGTHHVLKLAGHHATVYRRDQCGAPGLHLFAEPDAIVAIYEAMAGVVGGIVPNPDPVAGVGPKRDIPGRSIGWLAFNTARIEDGTPLFHVDFGPDALPAETGGLDEAVGFTKGCYLGQEIVARMKNLGHPKRALVGLKFPDDRLPVAGTQVYEVATDAKPQAAAIGVVTSSTVSPMSGGAAIAFAMVRWAQRLPGTRVSVPAEGGRVEGVVQGLSFLPPSGGV